MKHRHTPVPQESSNALLFGGIAFAVIITVVNALPKTLACGTLDVVVTYGVTIGAPLIILISCMYAFFRYSNRSTTTKILLSFIISVPPAALALLVTFFVVFGKCYSF